MSEEKPRKSHAGAWTTGIVAALVLYVLSIGPVFALGIKYELPRRSPGFWRAVSAFYSPIGMLADKSPPLAKLLRQYVGWCVNAFT